MYSYTNKNSVAVCSESVTEVSVPKHHATKSYRKSGGKNPRILDAVCGELHAPAACPQGKSLRYQLDSRLDDPQNQDHNRWRKNQTLSGIEFRQSRSYLGS
jgi:hypothetical protein